MKVHLKQRGRASIDFIADLGAVSARLSAVVDGGLQGLHLDLEADLDARTEQISAVLEGQAPHWLQSNIAEWCSTHHGAIAHQAFAEISPTLAPEFERLAQGPTRIETPPNMTYPDYWEGVEFHRTSGGWLRRHQGFIHGELIHPLYVGKHFPGQIFKQRADVLKELGDREFLRILEMGTSSGHYTIELARRYPNAELTGVELSLPMLEQAQRVANENHLKWRLIQAAAEDTRLPESCFDLVTSYILLHEVPNEASKRIFREGFRLLAPRGVLFMCDVRPFWDMQPLEEWRAHYKALHGGEPYWREAATLDLAQLAAEVGFANPRSYGLGAARYPWVTIAERPA